MLRLSLPDLDKAIAAYQTGNRDYFHIRDWETISGNFIAHVLSYNLTRTLFTYDFAEELLRKAGFSNVQRVAYRQTSSNFPEIVELDSRENEAFSSKLLSRSSSKCDVRGLAYSPTSTESRGIAIHRKGEMMKQVLHVENRAERTEPALQRLYT
jgi:hypothetical protein